MFGVEFWAAVSAIVAVVVAVCMVIQTCRAK
jgi:hypothetical protein